MIKYLSIGINPPPLDASILVVGVREFGDKGQVVVLNSNEASLEFHIENLLYNGFTLWAEI